MPVPHLDHSCLRHFLVVYDVSEGTATAQEFADPLTAALAYEALDPDGFGSLVEVTIEAAGSFEQLQHLRGRSMPVQRAVMVPPLAA